MEFRCLPLLFSLNVILMTAHAAIPPEVYWERMLPNTPMPKAILDIPKIIGAEEIANGVSKIQPEDRLPFIIYGVKKTQSKGAKEIVNGVSKIQLEDRLPFIIYGVKKTQSKGAEEIANGVSKIQSKDHFPFIVYGVKKTQSEGAEEIVNGVRKIQPEDHIPFLRYGVEKTYAEKRSLSQEDEMIPVANHHQHANLKADAVFFEEGLRPGTKLDAHFKKREYVTPLLPREIAQRIPFSSSKTKEIMEMLFVKPKPENVEIVEETISICEEPAITGEERHCATSLESMVDFVTSKLGKNAHVISTEAEKESKSQKFLVKDGVKMLAEDKVVGCHPIAYPYVVFLCHEISNSTAHFMPLEGEDGTRVKAAAVCHKDTSEWDPNHVVLQMLKIKPGSTPVCHIFPEGHLLWFAK